MLIFHWFYQPSIFQTDGSILTKSKINLQKKKKYKLYCALYRLREKNFIIEIKDLFLKHKLNCCSWTGLKKWWLFENIWSLDFCWDQKHPRKTKFYSVKNSNRMTKKKKNSRETGWTKARVSIISAFSVFPIRWIVCNSRISFWLLFRLFFPLTFQKNVYMWKGERER